MRTQLPLDTAWPLAIERLRRLDETVRDTGLRLGLEFLGVRTLHPDRGPFFIHTLAAALDLLEAAQVEASGLTVDSYHCHASGATFKQLRQTPAERITLLHINDAKPVPLEDLDDQDRLMPGEGIIDLGRLAPSHRLQPALTAQSPWRCLVRASPPSIPRRARSRASLPCVLCLPKLA